MRFMADAEIPALPSSFIIKQQKVLRKSGDGPRTSGIRKAAENSAALFGRIFPDTVRPESVPAIF